MKSCALTFHTQGILNAVKNVVCRKARRAGWRSLAVRSSSYVQLSESAKTLHYIFRSRSRKPSPQGRDARTPLSVVCPGSAALVRSTQLAVAVTWHCVTAAAAAEGRAAEQQTELPNNVNPRDPVCLADQLSWDLWSEWFVREVLCDFMATLNPGFGPRYHQPWFPDQHFERSNQASHQYRRVNPKNSRICWKIIFLTYAILFYSQDSGQVGWKRESKHVVLYFTGMRWFLQKFGF